MADEPLNSMPPSDFGQPGDAGMPRGPERPSRHPIRWTIAVVGIAAVAAVAANQYMPWLKFNRPMPAASSAAGGSSTGLSCPANAKPANLNFTLKDMNGQDVPLSKFRGKVILIDFWATWCEPCKVEIPWFIEFNKKYASKGLQVIGVSVDDTAEKLAPYVKDMKMDYLILQGLGHDDMQEAYGPILGIPVTVVISRDGKICATHAGLAGKDVFENEIKTLLEAAPSEHAATN
jgi:thiol-disulfide isomerase/thioredoxin